MSSATERSRKKPGHSSLEMTTEWSLLSVRGSVSGFWWGWILDRMDSRENGRWESDYRQILKSDLATESIRETRHWLDNDSGKREGFWFYALLIRMIQWRGKERWHGEDTTGGSKPLSRWHWGIRYTRGGLLEGAVRAYCIRSGAEDLGTDAAWRFWCWEDKEGLFWFSVLSKIGGRLQIGRGRNQQYRSELRWIYYNLCLVLKIVVCSLGCLLYEGSTTPGTEKNGWSRQWWKKILPKSGDLLHRHRPE